MVLDKLQTRGENVLMDDLLDAIGDVEGLDGSRGGGGSSSSSSSNRSSPVHGHSHAHAHAVAAAAAAAEFPSSTNSRGSVGGGGGGGGGGNAGAGDDASSDTSSDSESDAEWVVQHVLGVLNALDLVAIERHAGAEARPSRAYAYRLGCSLGAPFPLDEIRLRLQSLEDDVRVQAQRVRLLRARLADKPDVAADTALLLSLIHI